MSSSRKTQLADPASALASYLDDLLHNATTQPAPPATDTQKVVSEPSVQVQPETVKPAPSAPRVRRRIAPPPATRVVTPAPLEKTVAPAPQPELVTQPEPVTEAPPAVDEAVTPAQQPPASGAPPVRPEWSRKPFECLLFRVAGLQLAVPLILLGAIHRMEDKVKPIPGRPPWYMGILPDRGQNLRVVDSAEWIMAGRVPKGAREGYRFVIRLDDSEWALACDDVAQSFTLNPDEVRWRSARSKRPWLAGTVIQHMCALLDVGTMASMLAQAERDHGLSLE